MKAILLTLTLVTAIVKCDAQESQNYFYFAGGYNFSFPSASDLNYVIDRYNATRNYLTKKMDHVNSLMGPAFSLGVGLKDRDNTLLIEAGATFRNSGKLSAEGVVSGVTGHRDLKVTSTIINLGLGYLFSSSKSFEYGLALFTDIGSFSVKSRTYNSGQSEPDYTDITPDSFTTGLAFTPTGVFNFNISDNFGVSLRPFYYAQLFKQDLLDLDKTLNPNTWASDDTEQMDSETLSGPGIDLKAVVSF